MVRVRLPSGEEAVFRSGEEFRRAIRSGVVGPRSLVFHKAADRWLTVESHPEYLAAARADGAPTATDPRGRRVTGPNRAIGAHEAPRPIPGPDIPVQVHPPARQDRVSGSRPAIPPQPGPSPVTLEQGRPAGGEGPVAGVQPAAPPPPVASDDRAPPVQPPATDVPEEMAPTAAPIPEATGPVIRRPRTWRGTGKGPPRAVLTAALGLTIFAAAGAVGIGAGGLLRASGLTSSREAGMAPAAEQPAWAHGPLLVPRRDTFPLHYPAPSAPLPLGGGAEGAPAGEEPAFVSRFRAVRLREPTYHEAYAEARAEMDEALGYIQFAGVFDPSRFTTPESLRAARRTLAAARNIIGVYRTREVRLEQTYRAGTADPGSTLREPYETAQAAWALLGDADSLYGYLLAREGEYATGPAGLRFRRPADAAAYARLRASIAATLSAWRDSAPSAQRITMPRLIRGFDAPPPPAAP